MPLVVEPRAILHLGLAHRVPAYALSDILRVVDELYVANLWMQSFERGGPAGLSRLSQFTPTGDDALLTHRIDIGTPNFLELVGLTQPLLQASSAIGAVLGLAKIATSVAQSWAETRKAQAETAKLAAETAKLHLETNQLRSAAQRAPATLDPADRALLQRLERTIEAVSEQLLVRYVTGLSVILIQQQTSESSTPERQPSASGITFVNTLAGSTESMVVHEGTDSTDARPMSGHGGGRQ